MGHSADGWTGGKERGEERFAWGGQEEAGGWGEETAQFPEVSTGRMSKVGAGGQLAMTVFCVLLTMLHPGPAQPQWSPQGVAVALGVKATAVSLCPGNLRSPRSKMGSRGIPGARVEKGLGGQAGQWREKVRIREEGT